MEIIERDGIWTTAKKEIDGKTYDIKIEETERTTAIRITLNGKDVHTPAVKYAVFKDICDMQRQEQAAREEAEYCEGPHRMVKIVKHDGAWTIAIARYKGKYYDVNVKHFEEPSNFGIDNGRVSKLWIREQRQDTPCVSYDRGWDVRPKTKAAKAVMNEILAMYN